MIQCKGKYNIAEVFTDMVDNDTISQIVQMCSLARYADRKIRMMPDCHAGIGCTVGTTMEITDAVTPNFVGVDIGCGMLAVKLKEKNIDFATFDRVVKENFSGPKRICKIKPDKNPRIKELRCKNKARLRVERAFESIGTLGGGNHFIELDKDKDGSIWLVIHTGSRHLGIEVCNYYQAAAVQDLKEKMCGGSYHNLSEAMIADMRKRGEDKAISAVLAPFRKEYNKRLKACRLPFPEATAYCEGQLLEDYLHDMAIVQEYASINRATVAKIILQLTGLHEEERFETIHNYIDLEHMILRKGAVSAAEGEKLIVPINMRDGSLICVGKGNPDWNYSAPHGAGRLYSRSAAKKAFTVEAYAKTMKEHGIYTTSVGQETLDECPMAYKPIESIANNIQDTVDILDVIRPVYNYKSGGVV